MDLFACPRAFEGHTAVIQRNALTSWSLLDPPIECLLLGDESGILEVSEALHMKWRPDLDCDPFGTPLVSDLFARGEALCTDDILAYVNADIILMDDFIEASQRVAAYFKGRFLMIGRRTDMDIDKAIYFEPPWADLLRQRAKENGTLHQAAGVDYFVYRRGTLGEMPTFALGRLRWDNWIVWDVLNRGIPVIDASEVVLAIHQNHDFSHRADHGERQQMANDFLVRFSGGRLCTINDATHKLTKTGVIAR